LHDEWAYKPVGFVSYGGASAGTRGVQMTKQIVTTLKMMPVLEAVHIPFFAQHLDARPGTFRPPEISDEAASAMLDELLRWTEALAPLRAA
jgi:NAD(P)H-dependent FMN reductase